MLFPYFIDDRHTISDEQETQTGEKRHRVQQSATFKAKPLTHLGVCRSRAADWCSIESSTS